MSKYADIIEFIKELFPGEGMVPLHEPRFQGNEKQYLLDCIDSTFVSSVGEYVDRFEAQMAAISGTHRAVAVVNGTAALQVALRLARVTPGTEVLTQSLTFIATANAIAYNGAVPVFLDVDVHTMGLSPQALQAFLTEYAERREDGTYNRATGNRISACLPMHTFGLLCEIEAIVRICKEYDIPVIEDAAEAIGSGNDNGAAGSFGLIGIYSFNGNKVVTSGGGGALVTRDPELGRMAKHLTTTAKAPHPWEYRHDQLGYNFRMPNINAALACAQLEQLDGFLASKRELYAIYRDFFSSKEIRFVEIPGDTYSNHWLIALCFNDKEERDLFLKTTNESGVMTRPIWNLMHTLPMYSQCFRDDQKNAEYLEQRIVNIPSSARI